MQLLLKSQGRYAEAEPLYREALDASRRVLGPEHPDTLISRENNLAFLLAIARPVRRSGAAVSREALDARRRVLGAEHPDTLISVNNLASLFASQGRYAEAENRCIARSAWTPFAVF